MPFPLHQGGPHPPQSHSHKLLLQSALCHESSSHPPFVMTPASVQLSLSFPPQPLFTWPSCWSRRKHPHCPSSPHSYNRKLFHSFLFPDHSFLFYPSFEFCLKSPQTDFTSSFKWLVAFPRSLPIISSLHVFPPISIIVYDKEQKGRGAAWSICE